mmetsp:Transcript_20082/g.33158  ORF Transcript_20082/g.33158 Transcript_20082/m.33158 type:complete len:145 (+) Transcript_20082:55-489(+)|eukprot:CAMPEP_0203763522 /NCGR_PEP_ID=MMETSP0098-20131031/16354_1 /ASSEMBLY_ACC=CAM_ASM_000208 /TAXON_ID=96639 /ORGANISM=" , Strain NY0313808BC1" /LENGTH=144 /DNA_ID=CAMNT_0050658439 /DNA_START=50 /DNA_END=484 /DNA_ORIENTATION=+
MVCISDDLTWAIVRRNNSAVVGRRSGPKFTREANNLVNQPRRKYTGCVSKAVGVSFGEKGNSVLTLKTKNGVNKPNRLVRKVQLRHVARGAKACNQTIAKLTEDQYYCADLKRAAQARLSAQAQGSIKKIASVEYKPKTRSNKD